MTLINLPLFTPERPPVRTTPDVDALVAADAPVAIGVSGGKDSSAVAFATAEHLDRVGHAGPRVLVHSDLGLTEWRQSGPLSQRLADRLGLELFTVRRERGGMMERWEQRWGDNVARYAVLSCVRLILPWSTPDMRFCTSELKTDVICRALSKRYPGRTILSVTGIRRQESAGRAKAQVAKPQPKLRSVTRQTAGVDWHPIIDWSLADVFASLQERRFPLHEAYTKYGASRVSCSFCIMSAAADLRAAARCPENHAVYRRMVDLELTSTFAFQGNGWLADVAPELLSVEQAGAVASVKRAATERERAERQIPPDLLYTKGWPHRVPTAAEAGLLCGVRKRVAEVANLTVDFTTPDRLRERYAELFARRPKPDRSCRLTHAVD